jgi:hypothetical protein
VVPVRELHYPPLPDGVGPVTADSIVLQVDTADYSEVLLIHTWDHLSDEPSASVDAVQIDVDDFDLMPGVFSEWSCDIAGPGCVRPTASQSVHVVPYWGCRQCDFVACAVCYSSASGEHAHSHPLERYCRP